MLLEFSIAFRGSEVFLLQLQPLFEICYLDQTFQPFASRLLRITLLHCHPMSLPKQLRFLCSHPKLLLPVLYILERLHCPSCIMGTSFESVIPFCFIMALKRMNAETKMVLSQTTQTFFLLITRLKL